MTWNMNPLGLFEKSRGGFEEQRNANLAVIFFKATTVRSTDSEAILPQHFSSFSDVSVFGAFSKAFPEIVGPFGAGAENRRMRLQFNKIGYQIYEKQQSRRVPSQQCKPGQPGYGFRGARWRDPLRNEEDRQHCETLLRRCAEWLHEMCVHAFGSTVTVVHFFVACPW